MLILFATKSFWRGVISSTGNVLLVSLPRVGHDYHFSWETWKLWRPRGGQPRERENRETEKFAKEVQNFKVSLGANMAFIICCQGILLQITMAITIKMMRKSTTSIKRLRLVCTNQARLYVTSHHFQRAPQNFWMLQVEQIIASSHSRRLIVSVWWIRH